MEQEKELMRDIQLAHVIIPMEWKCSCVGGDGVGATVLCDRCFVESVLQRCFTYINSRVAVVNYTDEVDKASIYPGKNNGLMGLIYAVLGLAGEAGEVANKLKNEIRDNPNVVREINNLNYHTLEELGIDLTGLLEENGDALFYVTRTSAECGMRDIRQLMSENMVKVRKKREIILETRDMRDRRDKENE